MSDEPDEPKHSFEPILGMIEGHRAEPVVDVPRMLRLLGEADKDFSMEDAWGILTDVISNDIGDLPEEQQLRFVTAVAEAYGQNQWRFGIKTEREKKRE